MTYITTKKCVKMKTEQKDKKTKRQRDEKTKRRKHKKNKTTQSVFLPIVTLYCFNLLSPSLLVKVGQSIYSELSIIQNLISAHPPTRPKPNHFANPNSISRQDWLHTQIDQEHQKNDKNDLSYQNSPH